MKKIIFILSALIAFIAQSCISDDWADTSVANETVEQPIAGKFFKNALIEDFTGTWCQYCPRILHGLEIVETEGIEAIPVSIHRSSGSLTDPFNFPAQALESYIGLSGYPTAKIDRKTSWVNANSTFEIKKKISPNADLGLAINSTLNAGTINIDVDVKFANNFNNLSLVVYLVEDGLIYDQLNSTSYFGGQSVLTNFEHNHVLRTCLTDLVNGNILNNTTNGTTVTSNFNLTVPANIANTNNVSIVAFVLDNLGNVINVRYNHLNSSQNFQQNL